MEPRRAVDALWRHRGSKCICEGPVDYWSHYFDEEQDLYPDLHQREKTDSDSDQSE